MKAKGLPVNLSHLEKEDEYLEGALPVENLNLMIGDDMIEAKSPLHYDLVAQLSEDQICVHGSLELELNCQCVRCLEEFSFPVTYPEWTGFFGLKGEEKAEIVGDTVDLLPIIREDLLLAFPQHPLCSPDCTVSNKPSRSRSSDDEPAEIEEQPSPWSRLDDLKL